MCRVEQASRSPPRVISTVYCMHRSSVSGWIFVHERTAHRKIICSRNVDIIGAQTAATTGVPITGSMGVDVESRLRSECSSRQEGDWENELRDLEKGKGKKHGRRRKRLKILETRHSSVSGLYEDGCGRS